MNRLITRRMLIGGLIAATPSSALANKEGYVYDALGRIIRTVHADSSLAIYEYDAASNRTNIKSHYVGPSISPECFDTQYYLQSYPDIGAAGVNPYSHFTDFGWREGRNPNSFFSTIGYRTAYPDIAAANVNPLLHYINNGAAENRDPCGQFDTQLYRSANSLPGGTNPLYHYLTTGYGQGLSPQGDGTYRFGV